MTFDEYFELLESNKTKLVRLIEKFHPGVRPIKEEIDDIKYPITAPNAERACQEIRATIRHYSDDCPVTKFLESVKKKDINEIVSILNETWFGMPESSAIHNEPGFYVLCDLCVLPDGLEFDENDNLIKEN